MALAETLRRLKGQIAHTKRGEKGKKRELWWCGRVGGGYEGEDMDRKRERKKGVQGEVGEGV